MKSVELPLLYEGKTVYFVSSCVPHDDGHFLTLHAHVVAQDEDEARTKATKVWKKQRNKDDKWKPAFDYPAAFPATETIWL